VSVNESLKHAAIQAFGFKPADRLSMNLLLRDYEKGFFALHGRGPGSSNYPHRSVTGSFTLEAARNIFISGGCEIVSYPWLRYNVSSPSYSQRKEIRIRYSPSINFSVEGVYYLSLTTADAPEPNNVSQLDEQLMRNFRTVIKYSITTNLTLSSRICYKVSDAGNNAGVLLMQDISYLFNNIPLRCWFRLSVFNTDSWASRIYAYENDLLYSYSVPALYGTGSKSYLMLSWKLRGWSEVRFKYSVQSKDMGSAVARNTEEFRLQIRITI